jgi:HlyD family secretion protein
VEAESLRFWLPPFSSLALVPRRQTHLALSEYTVQVALTRLGARASGRTGDRFDFRSQIGWGVVCLRGAYGDEYMLESTAKAAPPQCKQRESALGLGSDRCRRRKVLSRVIWRLVITGLIAADVFLAKKPPAQGPRYETAEVRRGDLQVTVTATGMLSAPNSAQVGAEISGRAIKIFVDINDKVKEGHVLAEIDSEQYRAERDEAAAQLAAANPSRLTTVATANGSGLKTARPRSMQAERLASTKELKAAEAAWARADAAVTRAATQLTSTAASRKAANPSLAKTIIHSPINGAVLERSVEPGQTVSSGLQMPVLFTLAADPSEMLLAVKVDEADGAR